MSKDAGKGGCELIFKDMADKVKKGLSISIPIPHVGTFWCINKIAAIQFNNNVVSDSLGKTAKAHFQNKLFSTNVNRANLDILDNDYTQGPLKASHSGQLQNQFASFTGKVGPLSPTGIHVSKGAETWLEKNMGITLQDQEKGPRLKP